MILDRLFKKKNKPVHIWVTKMGEKIPVNELSDQHLLNILKFLQRRREAFLDIAIDPYGSTLGEGTSEVEDGYYLHQLPGVYQQYVQNTYDYIRIIRAEIARRKLEVV